MIVVLGLHYCNVSMTPPFIFSSRHDIIVSLTLSVCHSQHSLGFEQLESHQEDLISL